MTLLTKLIFTSKDVFEDKKSLKQKIELAEYAGEVRLAKPLPLFYQPLTLFVSTNVQVIDG